MPSASSTGADAILGHDRAECGGLWLMPTRRSRRLAVDFDLDDAASQIADATLPSGTPSFMARTYCAATVA